MQKKQVLSMMMATFSGRHKCFHNGWFQRVKDKEYESNSQLPQGHHIQRQTLLDCLAYKAYLNKQAVLAIL